MASIQSYKAGLGFDAGPDLLTAPGLDMSGYAWYVHHSGEDAASPRGREEERPLATLAQAYTNAAAGDIIVLLEGHIETISAVQVIAKAGLTIVSAGSGDTRAHLTRNVNDELLDITAAGVVLWNLYFPQSAVASANGRVRTAAADTWVLDCQFDQGANDTGPGLEFITGAGTAKVTDTTFTSVATAKTAQPHSAIKVTNAMTGLALDGVTIDGGTYGWSNPHALYLAAAVTRLFVRNYRPIRNSDAIIPTGTVGWVATKFASGSARTEWTP